MKKYISLVLALALALTAAGCAKEEEKNQGTTGEATDILQAQMPQSGEEIAIITTSLGEVKMRFFPEEAPKAVENFKTLAKDGYYDGVIFHRVIEDFMIQGGDPTGTGAGGESVWGEAFEDEISPKLHFFRGAVAMANRGPNTNGSQFFIVQNPTANSQLLETLRETRDGNEELGLTLNDKFYKVAELFPESVLKYYEEVGGSVDLEYVFGNPYTIFAQVFEGLETVDKIAKTEVAESKKPITDVVIEKITFEQYTPEGA